MRIPRRRFLSLAASAAGLPFLPRAANADPCSIKQETINSDRDKGVHVNTQGGYVEFDLKSPHWLMLTGGDGHYLDFDGDRMTMNMAKWNGTDWWSAERVLHRALGFGKYELSFQVGKGSGLVTTFYLSELVPDTEKDPSKRNPSGFKPNPAIQEIDFEMSGHCNNPKDAHHCRTTSAWTNVFWHGNQNADNTLLLPRDKNPDSTAQMYKYMIDWQRGKVDWHVDTGSGYQRIRSQDSNQTNHLGDYCESECYIFISFWHGDWMDSKFDGNDATANCGQAGKCYQAVYSGPLRFTPSKDNQVTRLGS